MSLPGAATLLGRVPPQFWSPSLWPERSTGFLREERFKNSLPVTWKASPQGSAQVLFNHWQEAG